MTDNDCDAISILDTLLEDTEILSSLAGDQILSHAIEYLVYEGGRS